MNGAVVAGGQFTNAATDSSWFVVPSAQVTLTFTQTASNVVEFNDLDSSLGDRVFASADPLAVGCDPVGENSSLCAESLIKLDVEPLLGRTIDRATLVLTTKSARSAASVWNIRALATAWSEDTVT